MFNLRRSKPDLIVHSEHPYNAEPPLHRLRASMVDRASRFLRAQPRQHPAHWTRPSIGFACSGRVTAPLDLSVAELRQRFAERTVTAVMQCAGNRRADMQPVRPTSGDPWAPGAIGNADWTGVSLCRRAARGRRASTDAALHVAFEACDEVDDAGRGTLPLRRLDPDGQGDVAGRAAGLRDERRAAGAGARVPAARGGAGLRRRAQPEMAAPRSRCRTRRPTTTCSSATTSWCRPT